MKQRFLWIILGVVVIAVLAFAGLAPLPGDKDHPSPLGEKAPPGQPPQPKQPAGPPHAKPGEPIVPTK